MTALQDVIAFGDVKTTIKYCEDEEMVNRLPRNNKISVMFENLPRPNKHLFFSFQVTSITLQAHNGAVNGDVYAALMFGYLLANELFVYEMRPHN